MPAMQERMNKYVPFIWFILIAFVWLGPTLAGRAIFALDGDLAIYYYAVLNFYSLALHTGQSFLWIPSIFSGFPIYLSQSGGFLDPVNMIIFKLLDGMSGVHVRLALDIILTLWVSFLAARALGLSRTAALFVGPSYLIALHLRFLSNPLTANTLFLLPLLIYTAYGTLRGSLSPLRSGVIAGIGLGWALLAGYTQLIVYALILTAIFVLGHVIGMSAQWRTHVRRLAVYGTLTLVLGTILSLPFILPAQKFLPLSARAIPAPLEFATLKVIEPGDLLLAFVPDYLYFPYITSGRKPMYVGALWFLLAMGALLVSLRAVRRKESVTNTQKGALVAGGTGLFALAAAFKWSPIFWVMTYLPVVGLFRFPFRFMLVGVFLLALLGGYGFDMLRDIVRDRALRLLLSISAAFAAAFLLFIGILHMGGETSVRILSNIGHSVLGATIYGRAGFTKDPSQYRSAIENGLYAYREFFSFSDTGVILGIGLFVLSCVLLLGMAKDWISFERGRRLVVGLVSLTVLCIPISQWSRYVSPEAVGMRPQALNAYVGEEVSLHRMYSFLPAAGTLEAIPPQYKVDSKEENAMHDMLIMGSMPNFHLYSGISSIDGYDQFESSDYLNAIYTIGGEHAASYGSGTHEERIVRLLSRLDVFGMMGGRYIVSGVPLETRTLSLMGTTSVSTYDIPLYIYEYKMARPIYYLATTTTARPHTSFKALMDAGASFEEKTFLDCNDCGGRAKIPSQLTMRERKNGLYTFSVRTDEERHLVLSESFLPGWSLTIDGAKVQLIRANGLYMAALVPPGEHTVTFEYQGLFNELSFLKNAGLVK